MTLILRGRRSVWWGRRVTLLAPRNGNDVSDAMRTNDAIHFAWQAQYLVRLEGDFSWQAQHFVTFCEIAGARNVVFYNTKLSPGWDESGPRSGGCEMTILSSDYRRISSNRLSIGGSIQGVSAEILSFKISWQAQYLVRLEGDFICSTHWKWGFICDADHWWHSFCVAGAVFGEVGGWLDLLHALEMRFHMWRRSLMTFILRGRCSIWWGWRVTWLAPRIGNEVSYVTQIIDDIHFAWQAQYLVRLEGDLTCCTHRKWDFICDADHWWHSFCVAGAVFGEVGGWLYWLHALEMRFHMWRIESKSWHHSHATAKASFKPQKKVWTAQWSVILRTFYRQILSWLYSSFFFWNFRHRLARELLVHVFFMSSWCFCVSLHVYLKWYHWAWAKQSLAFVNETWFWAIRDRKVWCEANDMEGKGEKR